jgi:hypothetical protein
MRRATGRILPCQVPGTKEWEQGALGAKEGQRRGGKNKLSGLLARDTSNKQRGLFLGGEGVLGRS